jgi:hypothetical protein
MKPEAQFSFAVRPTNLYMHLAPRYGETDMATLRKVERRRESRSEADLGLLVWCIHTKCSHFLQEARAREISLSGAVLSGLDVELIAGDVIGILYAGKKARYEVVWVRQTDTFQKVQAAVHRVAVDDCPWKELLLLNEEQELTLRAINVPAR